MSRCVRHIASAVFLAGCFAGVSSVSAHRAGHLRDDGSPAPPGHVPAGGENNVAEPRGLEARIAAPPESAGERSRRGQHRGNWRPPLTAEQRQHIIAVIGDLRPLSEEDRRRLEEMDADEFVSQVMQNAGRIFALARMRQYQPDLYELKIQELLLDRDGHEIARRIHAARQKPAAVETAALETRLRTLVGDQIDLQFRTRRYEIETLERRVTELRVSLQDDELRRSELIDARVTELVEDAASDVAPSAEHDDTRDES